MEGRCRGFPFVCEHIFQTHCSSDVLKSFSKDLLELGIGGDGINLRPLETSLTSSLERALLEKFLIYFSF